MRTPIAVMLAISLVALSPMIRLEAAPVRIFEVDSYQDFLKGDAAGVSIDAEGVVRLARAAAEAGTIGEAVVWCLVSDPAGTLYAGTGFDGRVIKITPDGKSTTFFDTDETHVTAMAMDATGALFAATSPHGKIYRIDASGKGEVFVSTDDKYVWALVFDAAQNLYAGTGDRGIVRKITRTKESSAFFTSGDGNVVCLAVDSSGNILAGGDTRGALYRIAPTGRATAIWSSDLREVRSILPRPDGSILIAATDARRESDALVPSPLRAPATTTAGAAAPAVTATVEAETVAATPVTVIQPSMRLGAPEKKARSTLVLLSPDGSRRQIWESSDETVFSVVEWLGDKVLVATGNRGRLYWVGADGVSGLATEFDAEQCTAMVRFGKDRVVCATNNKVALYRSSDAPAREGTYTSEVLDAGESALWGQVRWRGRGSGLTVSTRSGYTSEPDNSWSDWSVPLKNADGDQIASPPGRYLQWRASFAAATQGESAELDELAVSYRQRNSAPVISSVTVSEPGVVFQKSFSTGEGEYQGGADIEANPDGGKNGQQGAQTGASSAAPTGKRLNVRGLQTITWTASDPNNDRLIYQVSFRSIDEKSWKPMKKDYEESAYVIDTTALPDGSYRVRIEASDERDNPRNQALTSSRESSILVVDNTPPKLAMGAAGPGLVTVSDALSPIHEISLSLNGGRWQPLIPKDGLCDGIAETVEVPKLQPGQLAVVKAADSRGNFAVLKIGQ